MIATHFLHLHCAHFPNKKVGAMLVMAILFLFVHVASSSVALLHSALALQIFLNALQKLLLCFRICAYRHIG